MTAIDLIWIILLFFIQPLFLAGLLYSFWNRRKRLTYVRETYRMNFNRSSFEVSDYFFKAIIMGLVLSLFSIGLGVPLTIEWYLVYQLLSLILLLFTGSRFIHPLFTFSLTSIILFLVDKFGQTIPLGWLEDLTSQDSFIIDFKLDDLSRLTINSLFFITIILFFTTFLMKNKDNNKLYPVLRASKRGKTVAKYQNKFLWLLPLAVLVPGHLIEPIASWWPLLTIGGKKFGVILLPIIIGMQFTVSTQLIGDAIKYMKQDLQRLAGLASVLFLLSYFYREFTIWSLVIVLISGLFILYRHRQRENLWSFKYGPADEGLRVIAVRPDSPAERMDVSIGTIITHINDEEMNSKEDFYDVITYNRSYIKMRLKRSDGEIIMTETPLYDDDVNNLGLLIL